MHAGNPTLRPFEHPQTWADAGITRTRSATMTIQGTVFASGVLLATCAVSAVFAWTLIDRGTLPPLGTALTSALIGLVLGLIICFRPRLAPALALPYAVFEGGFVGAMSLLYAAWVSSADPSAQSASLSTLAQAGQYLVLQAVVLTVGTFLAMLIAYSSRLIRATPGLIKGIVAATIGVVFLMFGTWILRFFMPVPYLHEMGALGIGIAGAVVVIAALNLVIDFHIVESGAHNGAPRYMEWYGAFALLVTLVWLYLSILRLLALLNRRD